MATISSSVLASGQLNTSNVGTHEVVEETKSTSYPERVWNVAKKGKYEFYGKAEISKLFTDYCFTGKSSYYVSVEKYNKAPLEIKVRKATMPYTVLQKFTLNGTNGGFPIKTKEKFFLQFNAPSNCSGNVK